MIPSMWTWTSRSVSDAKTPVFPHPRQGKCDELVGHFNISQTPNSTYALPGWPSKLWPSLGRQAGGYKKRSTLSPSGEHLNIKVGFAFILVLISAMSFLDSSEV